MKMTAKEFIELVRKMREVQRMWLENGLDNVSQETELINLESQVDEAEVTDIYNLETNQPLV